MVEILVNNKEVMKIERVGGKALEKQEKERGEYKSSAKTVKGLVLGLLAKFRRDLKHTPDIRYSPDELIAVLDGALRKYNEVDDIGVSKIKGWKGKSGIIEVIKHPDRVIIKRMQKKLPGEKPTEVEIEVTKQQINAIIVSLNLLRESQPIETRDLAMAYSRILGLGHSNWTEFFGDRKEHNMLTTALCFLEKEGLIHYRRDGKTTILREKMDIQRILEV